MKRQLILILSLWLSFSAQAETGHQKERRRFNLFAELNYNTNSIKTKATNSTLDASTTSTIISSKLGGDFFFTRDIALTASLLFPLSTSIDAEITGFDFGGRYFPFSNGYQIEAELLDSSIESAPGGAIFFYGGFSNRTYQFSNTSLTFQGVELGTGYDLHFNQNYFFRGQLNLQQLKNTSSRTMTGLAAGFSLGFSF
jgi:hypothetical protein